MMLMMLSNDLHQLSPCGIEGRESSRCALRPHKPMFEVCTSVESGWRSDTIEKRTPTEEKADDRVGLCCGGIDHTLAYHKTSLDSF
jgi:hypothetical protein